MVNDGIVLTKHRIQIEKYMSMVENVSMGYIFSRITGYQGGCRRQNSAGIRKYFKYFQFSKDEIPIFVPIFLIKQQKTAPKSMIFSVKIIFLTPHACMDFMNPSIYSPIDVFLIRTPNIICNFVSTPVIVYQGFVGLNALSVLLIT